MEIFPLKGHSKIYSAREFFPFPKLGAKSPPKVLAMELFPLK